MLSKITYKNAVDDDDVLDEFIQFHRQRFGSCVWFGWKIDNLLTRAQREIKMTLNYVRLEDSNKIWKYVSDCYELIFLPSSHLLEFALTIKYSVAFASKKKEK